MVQMKSGYLATALQGQVLRFGVVGILNTIFSYSIYALGIYLGLTYYVASLISMIVGVMVSFATQGRLVFRAQLKGRFPSYLLMWLLLYLVNVGTIRWLLTFDLNQYVAGLIAAIPVVIASFVLQKFIIFKRS